MPSMVTIGRWPMADTGRTHARVAAPPRCTVHAPQVAIPHPYFVPVILSSSRKTQRRGVDGSIVTSRRWLLTLSWYVAMAAPRLLYTVYSFVKRYAIHGVSFCQDRLSWT